MNNKKTPSALETIDAEIRCIASTNGSYAAESLIAARTAIDELVKASFEMLELALGPVGGVTVDAKKQTVARVSAALAAVQK